MWTRRTTRIVSVIGLVCSLIPMDSFAALFSIMSAMLNGTWKEGNLTAGDNPVALLLQSIIQEHNVTTLEELREAVTNNVALAEGTNQYADLVMHVNRTIFYQVHDMFHLIQTVVPWIVTLVIAGFIITCCAPSLEEERIVHPLRRIRKRLIEENIINFYPLPNAIPDEEDLCSICWEPMCVSPQAQSATCRHHFHRSCVAAWLEHSTKCPACRQPYLNQKTTAKLERLSAQGQ